MVYVFLADGFETIEALTAVDMMRRAGIDVKTIGVGGRTITSSHDIPVIADLELSEAEASDALEMVILPGGLPGSDNLEASETVRKLICYAFEHDKYIAAICAAPRILGRMGLLEGRQATVYPGNEADLKGCRCTGESVTVDGKIITAKGAGVSTEFALKCVAELTSCDIADKISRGIQSK